MAEAERRLQAAQQRLEALQAEIPIHERTIDAARQAILTAVNWQLTIKEILWRGYLPDDDPAVVGLDQRVEQAAAAYRQAREQREQVMKAITDTRRHVGACEQGIQEARRRIFLAQHHADLLARLESLREEDPHAHVDAMAPDFYVRQARWRAQVREVEAEIAEVLQAAGV